MSEWRSDFDRGMIIGTRQDGLSISETADHREFTDNGAINKKHPVSSSAAGRSALLMRVVRGEGPDWWQEGDSNAHNHTLEK